MSFQSDFSATEPAHQEPVVSPTRSVEPPVARSSSPLSPVSNRPVIHRWDEQKRGETQPMRKKFSKAILGLILLVVLGGVGTGLAGAYFFPLRTQPVNVETTEEISETQVKKGAVFGVPDEGTFKDQTQGVLIKGGIEGEGSHTLLRPGGVSQNVYLTSSVVDLDEFNDMEVRIWGETFKGQKAGWLMDVGRVEVLSTSGEKPEWYAEQGE